MYAGWLDDLTAWMWKVLKIFFDALVAFAHDLIIRTLEQIFTVILLLLELLPMPEFLEGVSLGGMLASGGSSILWFADLFQIGPSLVLIGTAMVFYLIRRVLTVGIW